MSAIALDLPGAPFGTNARARTSGPGERQAMPSGRVRLVHQREAMLLTARIRVLLILAVFSVVVAAALVRIGYLGVAGSSPRATSLTEALLPERGEITESARANVVIRRNGHLLTPPVSSGLLAGVYRRALLEGGTIQEAAIRREDLESADQIWLVNSVRKWMNVVWREG